MIDNTLNMFYGEADVRTSLTVPEKEHRTLRKGENMNESTEKQICELIFGCHRESFNRSRIISHLFSKKAYHYELLGKWLFPNTDQDISSLVLAVSIAQPENAEKWLKALMEEYIQPPNWDGHNILPLIAGLLRSANWLDENYWDYNDPADILKKRKFHEGLQSCIGFALIARVNPIYEFRWSESGEVEFSKQLKAFLKITDLVNKKDRLKLLIEVLGESKKEDFSESLPNEFNLMIQDQLNYAIFGSLDVFKRMDMINSCAAKDFFK